jgi:hypothetical protein
MKMKKILIFKELKDNCKYVTPLIYFIMIVFLTCACAGGYKNQSSSIANKSGQESIQGKSKNGETNDDQKIECRNEVRAGSRIPKRICGTKEQWAEWDKKKGENAKGYIRDANEASRGNSTDPMPPVAPTAGMPMP